MDYLDFELAIREGSEGEYPVEVIRSPGGEARVVMRLPFDKPELENRLQTLEDALFRSGERRRRVHAPEQHTAQDFGQALFNSLLQGEVRNRYDVSLQSARGQDKGLRLKLHIQPPDLATIPWEFLYDDRKAEYVALSRATPLIRFLDLPQTIEPLTVTPPLRILGMVASPTDLVSLDVEHEKQRVEEAVRDLREKGIVELKWLQGQTWADLQAEMRRGPWHVFHFIGHCSYASDVEEGLIALANESGKKHLLSATQLGRLLADYSTLRFVLLNACEGARGSESEVFSSIAAVLTRRGVPAVIAMQYEITDRAATEFSHAFYAALADGSPVDTAITEARIAINLALDNSLEWATPVLYSRAPDGVLFEITKREPLPDDTDKDSDAFITRLFKEAVKRPARSAGIAAGVGLILLAIVIAYDKLTPDFSDLFESLERAGYTPNPSFSGTFHPGNVVQTTEADSTGEDTTLTPPILFLTGDVCFPDQELQKQGYVLPTVNSRGAEALVLDSAAIGKIFPGLKLRDSSVFDYTLNLGNTYKLVYAKADISEQFSSQCVRKLRDAMRGGDKIQWFSVIVDAVVCDDLSFEIEWEPGSSSDDRSSVKELAVAKLKAATNSTLNGVDFLLDNEESTIISIKDLVVLAYRGRPIEPTPSFTVNGELHARLSILLPGGEGDQRVTPSHTFRSGDKFQLEIMSTKDALLSIVNQTPDLELRTIWPPEEGESFKVNALEKYRIPPHPTSFVFDTTTGEETFHIVLDPVDRSASGVTDNGQPSVPENFRVREPKQLVRARGVTIDSIKDDTDQYIHFSSSGTEAAILRFQLQHQ